MKIYLAGPMRGIPEFNFPAFHEVAALLRRGGHDVFSPAERDIIRHSGVDISKGNVTGNEAEASDKHGFNIREAFAEDAEFICRHAEVIALLPGWETSRGAKAELALSQALGHEVWLLTITLYGWVVHPPDFVGSA
jgi:hypothetical protein